MNLSNNTLMIMRHSASAMIAAAAISGQASANNLPSTPTSLSARASSTAPNRITEIQPLKADEPKKEEGEKKKEERRDPCPPCGMG